MIHECINDSKNFGLIGIVRNKEIQDDNDDTQEEVNVVVGIKKKLVPVDHSLNSFLLKPDSLKGVDLFNHMIEYHGTNIGPVKPSVKLGIDLDERQAGIIIPTESKLTKNQ